MRKQLIKIPVFKAVLFLALASLLLAGCGGVVLNNWPGLATSDGAIYSAHTQLKKVDATNGSQSWVFPEKVDAKNVFYAQPLVVDDRVIASSYNNVVYMVDAESRTEIWSFTAEQDKGHFVAGPVVAGDLVLVPSSDHHLYALDLDTGKLVWKYKARAGLWAAVAVDENAAYLAGMDHYLYAVSLSNGQRLWEIDIAGPMLHAPVLDGDGILYLTAMTEEVIAVNTASQRVVWREPIVGKVWNPPLLHEGSLYFGTDEKKVYSIDASTGATNWTNDAGSAIIASPVLFGDSIAFTSEGGEVFTKSFDGANGWTRTIKGKLYSNPVVANDRLVVAGVELEHLLVTFDDQGKQDWTYDTPKE